MKCQRCQGLMVLDKIYDPDGQFLHIDVWRCLNCGETVDPTILQARQHRKGEKAGNAKESGATAGRKG